MRTIVEERMRSSPASGEDPQHPKGRQGWRTGGNHHLKREFPMKIGLLELLMGVETPMPPKMITPAAPDGALPRRLQFPIFPETELVPPCPVRGPEAESPPMNFRYITDFHRMDVNQIGSCLFLQNKKKVFLVLHCFHRYIWMERENTGNEVPEDRCSNGSHQ